MKASETFSHLPDDIKRALDAGDAHLRLDEHGFAMGPDDNGANAKLMGFVSDHVPTWE